MDTVRNGKHASSRMMLTFIVTLERPIGDNTTITDGGVFGLD